MGTKIEYSINPLAYTLVECNKFSVGVGVDVWEHYQKKGVITNNHCSISSIGVNKLQDPMDRVLDRNSIESIKKTMQMHEDIFKHQVKELHRVYNVQKMLMDDLKKEMKQSKIWNPMNNIGINHPYYVQQQQQATQISFGHVQNMKEDVYIKERSGSCSGEIMKRQRGFDLERPAERDIFGNETGPSSYAAFESCKISSNDEECDEEDMEVDLTLCIGSCSNAKNKKKKCFVLPIGCSELPTTNNDDIGKTRELNSYNVSFKSDRVGDCSDPTTPMSSSSVTFDQDKKGPHWLSQGLKLK